MTEPFIRITIRDAAEFEAVMAWIENAGARLLKLRGHSPDAGTATETEDMTEMSEKITAALRGLATQLETSATAMKDRETAAEAGYLAQIEAMGARITELLKPQDAAATDTTTTTAATDATGAATAATADAMPIAG